MNDVVTLTQDEIRVLKGVAGGILKAIGGGGVAAGSNEATDAEMEDRFGNPTVRKSPPKWEGQDFAGCTMSECSPDFLLSLAGFNEWRAKKDDALAEDDPKKYYTKKDGSRILSSEMPRKDARLARGWARRNRARMMAAPPAANTGGGRSSEPQYDDASDIPFLVCHDVTPRVQRARWERW